MKKIVALVVSMVLILGCLSVTVNAQYFSDPNYGLSFHLSDNWYCVDNTGDQIAYSRYGSEYEHILISKAFTDLYHTDMLTESDWIGIAQEGYSNSALASALSKANGGAYISVTSESEKTSYETHGGVKYFRFEKAYTATAYNYEPAYFYLTNFAALKNGYLYYLTYERRTDSNNYAEFAAMLDSISYDMGAVKIVVDGERAYPDSDPMIISDRTLVPIRAVAEKLGYNVDWDPNTYMVTLTSYDSSNVIQLIVGGDVMVKNYSQQIQLDVPAFTLDGRTYIPLRAVAEAMDTTVSWDEPSKTAYINSK